MISLKPKVLKLRYFWIVAILIILLPLVKEWRSFLYGEKVEGTYVCQKEIPFEVFSGPTKEKITKAEICYELEGELYKVYASPNLPYNMGERFPMKIHPNNSKHFVILSVKGFLIRAQTAVLVIVLLIWMSIFFTLRQMKLK